MCRLAKTGASALCGSEGLVFYEDWKVFCGPTENNLLFTSGLMQAREPSPRGSDVTVMPTLQSVKIHASVLPPCG